MCRVGTPNVAAAPNSSVEYWHSEIRTILDLQTEKRLPVQICWIMLHGGRSKPPSLRGQFPHERSNGTGRGAPASRRKGRFMFLLVPNSTFARVKRVCTRPIPAPRKQLITSDTRQLLNKLHPQLECCEQFGLCSFSLVQHKARRSKDQRHLFGAKLPTCWH